MADIDTAAIREHYNSPAVTGRSTPDIEALCDEIDALRARLAEVEAEAENLAGLLGEMTGRAKLAEVRAEAAETRLAEANVEIAQIRSALQRPSDRMIVAEIRRVLGDHPIHSGAGDRG